MRLTLDRAEGTPTWDAWLMQRSRGRVTAPLRQPGITIRFTTTPVSPVSSTITWTLLPSTTPM